VSAKNHKTVTPLLSSLSANQGSLLTFFSAKGSVLATGFVDRSNSNRPDPVVVGVKANKQFNIPTEAQRITPVPTAVAFCDTTKLAHFPPREISIYKGQYFRSKPSYSRP
jgi:hypothetical protein